MSRGGEKMADKNTTSNINLAAAEELPKAQSKFCLLYTSDADEEVLC